MNCDLLVPIEKAKARRERHGRSLVAVVQIDLTDLGRDLLGRVGRVPALRCHYLR